MNRAPTTLAELIGQQANRYGDKTALRDHGVDTCYAELDTRSNQVARALQAEGVRPGNRIGYLGKNDSRYFEILFGAAKAGVVLTPINWRLAEPEIEWILGNAEIACLFVAEQFLPIASAIVEHLDRPPTLVIVGRDGPGCYDRWRNSQSSEPVGTDASPDDVVVQLYTSGTTGRPKGAMLTHRNLLVLRAQPTDEQPEWNRFTDDDVSLIVMPIFHIGGTGFGLQTLAAGATALIATEFDAGQILDFIENDGLSKIFVVPSALQMLVRHPRARQVDYRRIRTILYGASPIPLALLREAIEVFRCGFVQMYGMTETSGTICALPPQDHDPSGNQRMQSAGFPLRHVELRIVDSEGNDVAQGEVGEVIVRAPVVMPGYWKLPDETRAVLSSDGWFRTGDAGYLDADGYLYIHDRVKDMIVTGGENVYPAEVEAALYGHPAIQEVAVIGVPSVRWGEEVKAIVVPTARGDVDAASIISWARERIAGYKVPKTVEFVEALPRGATGKILRRQIRDAYWAGESRKVG